MAGLPMPIFSMCRDKGMRAFVDVIEVVEKSGLDVISCLSNINQMVSFCTLYGKLWLQQFTLVFCCP